MNSLDGIKLTIIRSLSDTWRVLSSDKIGEGNVFIRNDLIIKLARYISSRFFFFFGNLSKFINIILCMIYLRGLSSEGYLVECVAS